MKNKIKVISILFILISFFIIGFDGSTYSELIDEVIVGEKRYIINLSASSKNFPDSFVEMYAEETLENMYINIFGNYKDKDGNDFVLNDGDYINYSCYDGNSTCSMYFYDDNIYNDAYLWYFEDSELPNSFLYNNVEYTLDHYYVSYANMMQYEFGKPVISVDEKNVNFDYYYGTEKISVSDDLVDNVHFDWEFFMPTVKVTNNVVGSGVDPNKEFEFVIEYNDIPNGKYGNLEVVDSEASFSLKAGESIDVPFIGTNIYLSSVENGFLIDYTTNSFIIDNGHVFNSTELTGGEIVFTHTFTAAKPLVIKNSVVNGDNDKEFGYTISLSDSGINGLFSGINFTNGIGRFHLKNGEEKSILLPAENITYRVNATSYTDYTLSKSSYSGTISSTSTITHEFVNTYWETTALDGVYSATVVSPEEMVEGRSYVAFRATGGVGYLLTGKGNAKVMTSYGSCTGCKVTWPDSGDAYSNVLWTFSGTPDKALFESFGAVNTYLTVGKSTSGKRPVGNEVSYVKMETTSSPAVKISNDNYFLALMSGNEKYTSSTSGSSLYFAEIDENIYNVEFSGSNDGLHIYPGTVEKEYSVIAGDEIVVPGEDSVKKPVRYNHGLDSWIELSTGLVLEPGDTFQVNGNYKFYANWVPNSYDIGVNENVVGNLDTSSFINTEIFDYNELYNLYSTSYNNNRWSLLDYNNKNVYFNHKNGVLASKGIVFVDNYSNAKNGLLTSVDNRNKNNASKQVSNGNNFFDGIITPGLSNMFLGDLFNKNSTLHGIKYVGSDNFLYQYDDNTGYYYYDSTKNAASYNKKDNRFYVYDYVIGTSKAFREGENKADFLPFNYLSKEDVSKGKNVNASNGAVNYWFGLKSEISFNLVDEPGVLDELGEYGNKDQNGNDMIFKITGEDDVFVAVDDNIILDLGGLHDGVYGEINFSTGIVSVAQNGASIDSSKVGGIGYSDSELTDATKVMQTKLNLSSGAHKLTLYYVDRGASRSNIAMYFNISDVYDKPGNIVVKRNLNSFESDVEHNFTMTLSDDTIEGVYGDLLFSKGVSRFALRGGESVTVSDLPAGVSYKVVVEIPKAQNIFFLSNGKTYTTEVMQGRVVGGNTLLVEYVNEFDETTVPKTYDNIYHYVNIMAISFGLMVLLYVYYILVIRKRV